LVDLHGLPPPTADYLSYLITVPECLVHL
jgi:hypothetical protein